MSEVTAKVGRVRYGEIIGNRYTKLVVMSYVGTRNKQRRYLCRCDCGKETEVSKGNLIRGVTKSCGCIRQKGLKYAPKTGLFYREGRVVTCRSNGYLQVYYKGKQERGHRVAWMMMYGEIPKGMVIDHINRIRHDNRIENLRPISHADNVRNQNQSRRLSKYKGVNYVKPRGKWRVRVKLYGKDYHIGTFETEELAAWAYDVFLDEKGDTTTPRNRDINNKGNE